MDNQVLNNMTSINDIIVFFKRHKHTIISFGFIIAICTALFACLMQPIYRSTTSILIDSRQSNILDNTAILSNLGSDSSVIDSQVEIIRSPSLLSRVARKERLYQRQDFYKSSHSVLTVIGILLGIHKTEANYINADTSSSILLQIEQNRPTETSFIYDWISLVFPKPELQTLDTIKERVIQKLQENLTVKRQGKSLILLVSYESPNSALSTKIVNRIAQEYLNDQLETKLEATKRATNWLTERLSSLRNELKIKEATIAVFKQKNNLFGASKITQIEQQVTKLNEQLINANVETVEKLARYNQVKALARNGSLQSYSGFVSSGTVSNLRVQESRALGIVAHLSGKYGENHPQLINARAKLHDIRKQINDEANRMIDNAKSEYNIAHRRESSLKASLDTLKGQFDITGTQSVRLQQLEREAEAARTAYETISERFRETDKSDEIQQSDARIISIATIPLDPVKPQKILLTVIGFIFGTLIGISIGYLRDNLIKGYLQAETLQNDTGINVISSVMSLSSQELKKENRHIGVHNYIIHKPLSAFSESISRIRVGVESAYDNKNNIVMMTSSVPNEGKTTISINYALSLAQAGKKVILIDTDFRKPALTQLLYPDIQHGLSEYLADEISVNNLIYQTEFNNLDFIGIKDCPKYPIDLLKSNNTCELFSYLRQNYDLVLIDTPPLKVVIDARVIAEFCDAIVYITAWETTSRKTILETINLLPNTLKQKIVGLVLNKIDVEKEMQYGYEFGYGYDLKKYASYYQA